MVIKSTIDQILTFTRNWSDFPHYTFNKSLEILWVTRVKLNILSWIMVSEIAICSPEYKD